MTLQRLEQGIAYELDLPMGISYKMIKQYFRLWWEKHNNKAENETKSRPLSTKNNPID